MKCGSGWGDESFGFIECEQEATVRVTVPGVYDQLPVCPAHAEDFSRFTSSASHTVTEIDTRSGPGQVTSKDEV